MKLGWRIFIVLTAVVAGLYLSRRPWEVYREQQAKANGTAAEMQVAEKEHERLLKQKTEYSSALGKEKILRDKGYLKTGETPVGN